MGDIVRTVTPEELQQEQQLAQAIASASVPAVQAGQFVFFAAFDGTNNIKSDPAYSGDPQSTNVGQLADQMEMVSAVNSNLISRYYPGPGTPGTLPGSSFFGPVVTQQIIDTANQAYNDFADRASKWLDANPGGSVTTAITGFSRGGPAGVVFAQLLDERGLIDPRNGNVLIPPGQVGVSAMLLFDPVSTGFGGDLGIPSNVNPNNIAVVQALDEFRVMYKGDDYSADPRVRIFGSIGDHGDIGGFYDQGLGALPLQGATGFFQNAGIAIGDVPPERQFNADEPSYLHTEGMDSYGNRIWDEYGTRGNRLMRPIGIAPPVLNLETGISHSVVTLNDAGQLTMTVDRDISGHRVKVEFVEDEWGDLKASRVLTVDGQAPASAESFANALNTQGYSVWDFADGQAPSGGGDVGSLYTAFNPMQPAGSQTLYNAIGQYGGTLIDALSLIKAIQSGDPLPIAVSGLRLANDINTLNGTVNLNLSVAANVASGILSLMSLDAALERGDTLGAVTAGAQAISFGATAYANFVGYSGNNALQNAVSAGEFGAAGDALGAVSKALPYLSLVNSIAHGDAAGVAVASLNIMVNTGIIAANTALAAAVPVIGWAYAVYSIIDSLFGGGDDTPAIPAAWGSGHYIWSGTNVTYTAAGQTGGQEAVSNTLSQFLHSLNTLVAQAQQQNPGSTLGLIPNRMPTLSYSTAGFQFTDIDPVSGVQQHPELRYDNYGRPYNAEPGSPESFQSLGEAFIRSALARGAIAPEWEVLTAKMQTDAGDPKAGLTEEARAGQDGQLSAPISGTTQTFRPVALDLNGDGVQTTGTNKTVAFDVDDSGFMKNTAWLDNNDAFLTLDRNYNGSIDSGKELFSNATVALERRGLASLAGMDANYDGKLTAADPVWDELKVWQDADGLVDMGESFSLTNSGEFGSVHGIYDAGGKLRAAANEGWATWAA